MINKQNILKYQQKFRILKDWTILFKNDNQHYSQCDHNSKTKIANIYPFRNSKPPKDYILHEILHIAFEATINDQQKLELLIQDICKLKIKRYF